MRRSFNLTGLRVAGVLALLAAIAFGVAPASAQAAKLRLTSTVSGHVTCADTNTPARLATVMLIPVSGKEEATAGPMSTTDFNGEYVIAGVPSGRYVVSVALKGYLRPDPLVLERIRTGEQAVPPGVPVVDVSDGANAAGQNVTLQRGASVFGTVLYDDGSPAIGARVSTFFPKQAGQTPGPEMPRLPLDANEMTDAEGHYRFDGLAAGLYGVEVLLTPTTTRVQRVIVAHGENYYLAPNGPEIHAYYGGTFRSQEAKQVELHGADQVEADITVGLSKLVRLSGRVTAPDGHPVEAGLVTLTADKDPRTTDIDAEGTFAFDELPEGSYKLHVYGAADVAPAAKSPVEDVSAFVTTRMYGEVTTTVTVHGSETNLQLTVPDASARK